MSMSLQVEAVTAYQPQATGAALFPLLRQPQLAPMSGQHDGPAQAKVDNRLDFPLSELHFRHLKTADDIAGIVHLRKEIQVVAAGVADPAFVTREKKETRRALWPLSNAAATSSGRFALSR